MKKFTKEEIQRVEAQYSVLCGDENALERVLEEQFKDNAGTIQKKLEEGVDKFYKVYSGTVDEQTLTEKLQENMRDMTPKGKYLYLSNLLLALSQVCGSMVEGSEWREMMKENKIVLAGLESGALSEDSAELQEGIGDMLALVGEQSHAFSVLFIGSPSYQKLMRMCLTANPAIVKALAANTRKSAVNMAAALYLLEEQGKLPSLNGVKIPPEEMGVMSASLLEIDAAQKNHSWEKAKEIIEKAAKTSVTLLVASPSLIADTASLLLAGILLSFSSLGTLVLGAILLINARMHLQRAKEHLEPVLNAGAKILDTTLDKVRDGWMNFKEWVSCSVLPAALPVWRRCRDFVVHRIMLPSASFLLTAKAQILEKWQLGVQAIRRFWEQAKEYTADFMDKAATEYGAAENVGEMEILGESEEYADELEPVAEDEEELDEEELF